MAFIKAENQKRFWVQMSNSGSQMKEVKRMGEPCFPGRKGIIETQKTFNHQKVFNNLESLES